MKRFTSTLLLILLCALSILAQNPTPTPPDDEVVKISTTLIQIDVSVTDKNGKTVKDLKPEDFEIYENQTKQTITNFSFIQTENSSQAETKPTGTASKKDAVVTSPVPISPARLKPENVRRTIAFVVDDLSLGFDGIHFTRKALKNFVDKQMQDGDLIAILRTGTGIGALQQFTSDKRVLYAAIENIRLNPYGTGGNYGLDPTQPTLNEQTSEANRDLNTAEAEYEDFRQSVFASGTLGAVNFVLNGMRDLPGRKSIMLLSNRIGLKKSDGERDEKVLKSLRSLIESANRASVVIYTMTARGMPYDLEGRAEGASYPGALSEEGTTELQNRIGAQNARVLDEVEKQEGLVRLSRETGGLAIINRKELSTNIQTVLDDQKGYYLIGYQPDDETFDAKTARFNKLTVKVNRPDIRVRYRSGFFGLTDDQIKTNIKLTPFEKISQALTSPFAKNEINVRMTSLFGNTVTGSFVRSFLHIQSKDITFTDEPDGWKKATFDVFAFIFGDNGLPIDQISRTHTFRINSETYQQILESGFVYNLNMMIKKPGAYQFRLALRDVASEKIGSANQFIEVPDLQKKRLTISGVTLEKFTLDEWEKNQQSTVSNVTSTSNALNKTQNDTALRRFKRGSILTFGYTIYNAKLEKATTQPNLQTQIRLFRDGKLVLNGAPKPVNLNGNKDLERVAVTGAISLVDQMQPGEYVLQIIVTDVSAKKKAASATQLVEFEIEP